MNQRAEAFTLTHTHTDEADLPVTVFCSDRLRTST